MAQGIRFPFSGILDGRFVGRTFALFDELDVTANRDQGRKPLLGRHRLPELEIRRLCLGEARRPIPHDPPAPFPASIFESHREVFYQQRMEGLSPDGSSSGNRPARWEGEAPAEPQSDEIRLGRSLALVCCKEDAGEVALAPKPRA